MYIDDMDYTQENYTKYVRNKVVALQEKYFPDHGLDFICGGGAFCKPKVMFIFINPTYVNTSTHKNWQGIKAPFIGTTNVWRVFYNAGLLTEELFQKILVHGKNWTPQFAEDVYAFLENEKFFLTNIVKYAGHNANLPQSDLINLFMPILEKEIEIVDPEHIITFGHIPFQALAKTKLRMEDAFTHAQKTKTLQEFKASVGGKERSIIPVYFPTGRGNPKRAAEMLRLVQNLI